MAIFMTKLGNLFIYKAIQWFDRYFLLKCQYLSLEKSKFQNFGA